MAEPTPIAFVCCASLALACATVSASPQANRAFRLIEHREGSTGSLVLQITEDGLISESIDGIPSVPRRYLVRLEGDSIRRRDTGLVLFERRAADGVLVETVKSGGLEQDLFCRFTPEAHLRCEHGSGDGPRQLTFSVQGGRILLDANPRWHWTVEPAPTTPAERRRVLMVLAVHVVGEDTDSHDGDTTFDTH
jgi:hypothetical protein